MRALSLDIKIMKQLLLEVQRISYLGDLHLCPSEDFILTPTQSGTG